MLTPTTAILLGSVALIVFGPKQLPELAKSLGKAMGEFKKGVNGEGEPMVPPSSMPAAGSAPIQAAPAPAPEAAVVPTPPAAAPAAAQAPEHPPSV